MQTKEIIKTNSVRQNQHTIIHLLLDKFFFGVMNNYVSQQCNEEKSMVITAAQTPLFLQK